MWCRSCTLGLKKRCGGLQSSDVEEETEKLDEQCDEAASTSTPMNHEPTMIPNEIIGARRKLKGRQLEAGTTCENSGSPHLSENSAASATIGVALALESPPLTCTEAKWVQCSGCTKWRLLPDHVSLNDLPDDW